MPLVLTVAVTYQATATSTFFFLLLPFHYFLDIESIHIASSVKNHVENAFGFFFLYVCVCVFEKNKFN